MPPDDRRLAELVRRAQRIAIVGLSPRPERPSHGVARYLQRAGYTIIPVHPAAASTWASGSTTTSFPPRRARAR